MVRRIIQGSTRNYDVIHDGGEEAAAASVDQETVTLFQLNDYVTNALQADGHVDLGKLIDLLAYESESGFVGSVG